MENIINNSLNYPIQEDKGILGNELEKKYSKYMTQFKITSKNEEINEKIRNDKPYGEDPNGDLYMIPQKKDSIAYSIDMVRDIDHGKFYNSGWGRKFWPTVILPIIFFFPAFIFYPLHIYKLFGSDAALISLKQELINYGSLFLLIIIMLKLIDWLNERFSELIKPYGKESHNIRKLFINDVEYLKFSYGFFRKTLDFKNSVYGAFFVLLVFAYHFYTYFSTDVLYIIENSELNLQYVTEIPTYLYFTVGILINLGMGLTIFLVITLITTSIIGMRLLGNLGSNRKVLSNYNYGNMLKELTKILQEVREDPSELEPLKLHINRGERSFYEFQRGNRFIGIILFQFSAILVSIFIAGILIIEIVTFYDLPVAELGINTAKPLLMVFSFLSLVLFVLPQYSIHIYLKRFKYKLIDHYASIISSFEFFYFESFFDKDVLNKIDKTWKNRATISKTMKNLKNTINEIEKYGTWSYDFPEVLKLVVLVISTFIPLLPLDTIISAIL